MRIVCLADYSHEMSMKPQDLFSLVKLKQMSSAAVMSGALANFSWFLKLVDVNILSR